MRPILNHDPYVRGCPTETFAHTRCTMHVPVHYMAERISTVEKVEICKFVVFNRQGKAESTCWSVPSDPFSGRMPASSPLLQHHIPKASSWHVSDVAYDCIRISILWYCQCFHNLRCLLWSCHCETDAPICFSRVSHGNEWPWRCTAKRNATIVTPTRFCGPPACLWHAASSSCCTWLN